MLENYMIIVNSAELNRFTIPSLPLTPIIFHIFGGFELSWIQMLESGLPLTFSFANSPNNYYPTFAGTRRPDVNGKPALRDSWDNFGGDRFNLQNINPVIDPVFQSHVFAGWSSSSCFL